MMEDDYDICKKYYPETDFIKQHNKIDFKWDEDLK